MNRKTAKIPFASTLILAILSNVAWAQTSLINNINGYTVNNGNLVTFSAIQFTKGKIDSICTQKQCPISKGVKVIDGKGKTVLPGLIDAHGHVLGYGLNLSRINLRGITSEQAAVEKALAFRKENPDLAWIQGRGWNQVLWDNKVFPTKTSLDKAFPNTPVWLRRIDGHAAWGNSTALNIAGITKDTVSPDGGEILRDKNGEPTGVFIDNAQALVTKHIPELSAEEKKITLKKSMLALAKLGLTGVHDAGVSSDTLDVFKSLADNNELPIRIYAMIAAGDNQFDKLMQQGPYHHPAGKLDIASIKILSDGALGSRGAALIEDYSDKHGHKGLLLYRDSELKKIIKQAMSSGFQVNTHAIGDKANQLVLDHYENLISKTNSKALRHRIEHAQVLQLSDIPRFNQLGVIASMQATHATSDKNMAEDRLGAERIKGAYAWRKLLDSNAVIAAGSDFPIESANPFFGLFSSISRQDHQNQPPEGWYPQERMSRTEALASFTTNNAFASHKETQIGQLTPGMKADLIIIDRDIFEVPQADIWQTKVLQTWVDGKKVFTR
ncbi:amidohydrolase family protein [Shewanella sp. 202IG2-18]|uniref:amidohydrolase n=1 Tax=Parashewanella hymeniacidonis TaxID=2807618 RepID=UPI00196118D7|nr:amidohydrolase [Parashewanella hymeniacidonis]MBM7071879.1 amidohydrolase family protein [Parashewanella hymeniacidonis]